LPHSTHGFVYFWLFTENPQIVCWLCSKSKWRNWFASGFNFEYIMQKQSDCHEDDQCLGKKKRELIFPIQCINVGWMFIIYT